MGKTTSKTAGSSVVEMLADALSNVNKRRGALLLELSELDSSLRAYGIDPRRFAGEGAGNRHQTAESPTIVVSPTDSKRRRRQAPPLEWIVAQLSEGKRSQPELARRASASGFSDTAAVALLKNHEDQFAWERAPRQDSQRGMAPIIWSLKR